MALQISYEDGTGTTHPEAYARIGKMIVENQPGGQKNVCVDVCIFASKTARDAGKLPVWGPQAFQLEQPAAVQPEPTGDNPNPIVVMECAVDPDTVTVADVYTFLKTKDQFSGGIDV